MDLFYKQQAFFNSEIAARYLFIAERYPDVDTDRIYERALTAVKRANIFWQGYVDWNNPEVTGVRQTVLLKLAEVEINV